MLDPDDRRTLETMWPLIKAWGLAIEKGHDGEPELDALKAAATQDPESMRTAIYYAERVNSLVIELDVPNLLPRTETTPEQKLRSLDHLLEVLKL